MKKNSVTRTTSAGKAQPLAVAGGAQGDMARLRQQLVHARAEIADLQEELQEKNNLYLNAIKERDTGVEKLNNAKESLNRFEALVKQQVDKAMEKERQTHSKVQAEKDSLEQRLKIKEDERISADQKIKGLQDQVQRLKEDAEFYQKGSTDLKDGRIDQIRANLDKKEKENQELKKQINYLQDCIEDFMAENKALRDLASVPSNYGIDREKIKLMDREKIDDFKKLIRVLQDDNYRLEEERAKLKHKLKQMAMLSNCNTPGEREIRLGLTKEQISIVDDFAQKLANGEAEMPADVYRLKKENEDLKRQMESLNNKGFDFIKGQLEGMIKNISGGVGGGSMSQEQFNKIQQDNQELKALLQGIGTTNVDLGMTKSMVSTNVGGPFNAKMQPPVPRVNPDQTINRGYSHKFNIDLPVTGRNGEERGIDMNDAYDNAFLQLQLMECFELIARKDEALKSQKREIDTLYGRIKKYLYMQDHLYKEFVEMESNHAKVIEELKVGARNANEAFNVESMKVKSLEQLVQNLEKNASADDQKSRLIELTKQNSLLEVNLIKMTRKYQALEEQEKLLRRNYQNVEQDMAEMETACMQRINSLKEWKRNATFQLKQLYEQMRVAIPLAEYESVTKELEIYKQKNGDLFVRNSEYAAALSGLQAKLREVHETVDAQRNMQGYQQDLEKEYNQIRSRLEALDPKFRWENQMYHKIAQHLKRSRVSLTQAFEYFDQNGNGSLDRSEFIKALDKLGLSDLSGQEVDVILKAFDIDGDGTIQYKEFIRKLQRSGLKNLTSQEMLAYNIIRALKRLNMTKSDLFKFINKDGEGLVTRKDFRDILSTLNMKEVSDNDIKNFIEYFYKDEKGGIDLKSFLRIFEKYEKAIEADENPRSLKDSKRAKVPTEVLRMKQNIFEQLHQSLTKAKVSLRTLFAKIDRDGSMSIDQSELQAAFRQMNLNIKENEMRLLFQSIDLDGSGHIDWAELKHDFDKCTKMTLRELEEEQRLLTSDFGPEEIGGSSLLGRGEGMGQLQELEYQRRISTLEDKLKQAYMELRNEHAMRNLNSESVKLLQKHHDDLRKKFDYNMGEYFKIQRDLKEKDERLKQCVPKATAQEITKTNQSLMTEVAETRAALLSYKSMHNVVCEQVKQLKIMHERGKDENESLIQSLREMQSENFDKQKFGKMYYVVMLSRWQEAAVNKKYAMKISEAKELKGELLDTQTMLENQEHDYHKAENELKRTKQHMLTLKQELQSCKNMFLTLQQGDEFNRIITELTDERTRLEDLYFKTRSDCVSALNMLDEAKIKAEEKGNMLQELRISKPSELSDKLIAMSETLQKLRLSTMKSERRAQELEERENYLSKLLGNRTAETTQLEQQVAKLEKELHVKEEKWRIQDNDRMRQFFGKTGFTAGDQTSSHQMRDRPHTAAGPGGFKTSSEQSARHAHQEQQVEKLTQDVARLKDEINYKDGIIRKLKQWQGDDAFIGADGDGMKDLMDEQRVKFQAVHDQESKEMADAAYQTIKTLNEMLEQKKVQVRSKEEQIDRLRQQLAEQRELHAEQMSKLQNEVSATGKSTLANLQRIVNNEEKPTSNKVQVPENRRHDAEFQKIQKELEHMRTLLNDTQNKLEDTRSQLLGEQKAKNSLKSHFEDQVRQLEDKVKQERDKREKLAKTRVEKNEKLIQKFQQQMVDYEAEILKLKDNNEVMKMKSIAQTTTAGSSSAPVQSSGSGTDKQITDLQNLVKKRDQDLVKQKEKEIKATKERQELQSKMTEVENKLEEEKKKVVKYLKEKQDALDSLRNARQQVESEIFNKNRFKEDLDKLLAEKKGQGGGLSYSQMTDKIKGLENDIYILEAQKKTVIAVNPQTGAFEYIGDPVDLSRAGEVKTIEEAVDATKEWLSRPANDRLSILQIFEGLDPKNQGEIQTKQFESAFNRLGLKLKAGEFQLFKQVLDPKQVGYMQYRSFVRETQGVPQLDFMHAGVVKLAKVANSRDLNQSSFMSLIDPNNLTMMTSEQFKLNMEQCAAPDFSFTESEISSIFKFITKAENRTVGLKLNTQDLAKKVFLGVHAILIDQVRVALEKNQMSLGQLFQKYDGNKDGLLEHFEIEKALKDCHLTLGKEMTKIFLEDILSNSKAGSTSVSFGVFKFYLDNINVNQVEVIEQIESGNSAAVKITSDVASSAKMAARKILIKCFANIAEIVGKLDTFDDGVVNKDEIKRAIEAQKVSDLDREELAALFKVCDKGQKGYVSSSKFVENLFSLASESESETIMRRVSKNLAQANINLKQELSRYDTSSNGKLDKTTIKKPLKQLAISLSDIDINKMLQDQPEQIDIKKFCSQVDEASRSKPLPSNVTAAGQKGKAAQNTGGAMGAFEAEKKYKKNLEALKSEIEEKNRDISSLEKEIKDCNDRYNRLEHEKKALEARLVDKHSKPPKETQNQASVYSQAQEIAQLKDQLFASQQDNTKLRRTIEVTFKAETSRLTIENEKLEEKLRDMTDDRNRFKNQFDRIVGAPMDNIDKREALELSRQMKIDELSKELDASEKARAELQDQLFKAEEKLLDLKFEKESFDLQYARLQKRIQDLEQMRHTSALISSNLERKQAEELKEISDATGVSSTSKKSKETNRLKNTGKSTAELEMLVESLKRVVDKLKTENEALKKENQKSSGQADKVASEKALRQKINNLEALVHSLEMKEINLDEKDNTIKKLIQANKQLREDLGREVDRYILLEDKFNEVLIKYETISKSNAKNEELIFGMTTGGSMSRYGEFLSDRQK